MATTADIPYSSWATLIKANLNCLFQTALLLSADPEVAEASVAATIDSIDLDRAPGEDDWALLRQTLVSKTFERLTTSSLYHGPPAQSMLPRGLLPLLGMEQLPRIYFVLRVLLRWSVSSSAQILGIEEADAGVMFQAALWQLCEASQISGFERELDLPAA